MPLLSLPMLRRQQLRLVDGSRAVSHVRSVCMVSCCLVGITYLHLLFSSIILFDSGFTIHGEDAQSYC